MFNFFDEVRGRLMRHGVVSYVERNPPPQPHGETARPLEDFIITVFCWVEEHMNSLLVFRPNG
jgi:hypothetical protein